MRLNCTSNIQSKSKNLPFHMFIVFLDQFGGTFNFVHTDNFSIGTGNITITVADSHDRGRLTRTDPSPTPARQRVPDSYTLYRKVDMVHLHL